MRRLAAMTLGCLLAMPGPLLAAAPDHSVRPIAREAGPLQPVRPQSRPLAVGVTTVSVPAGSPPAQLAFLGPDTSPFPFARPPAVEQKALFGKRKKKKGSVCGEIEIQGEKVGDIPGKIRGCGVEDAVRVKSVSGVMLSQSAVMTCDTAKALNKWVEKTLKPTFRQRGPVVEMKVAAHYACRTRNNQPGGRISEHGKGKAIDISAFEMQDGETVTVLEGWKRGSSRRLLQKAWKGACGPFGTVLGPESDGYHRNHFHFDTASYRGGPYCR